MLGGTRSAACSTLANNFQTSTLDESRKYTEKEKEIIALKKKPKQLDEFNRQGTSRWSWATGAVSDEGASPLAVNSAGKLMLKDADATWKVMPTGSGVTTAAVPELM